MIQQVERLNAELAVDAFHDGEGARQRQIEVRVLGPGHLVTPCRSELSHSRDHAIRDSEGGGIRVSSRVEPLSNGVGLSARCGIHSGIRIRNQVGAIRIAKVAAVVARRIGDGEWPARLEGEDTGDLEATKDFGSKTLIQISLSTAEGQLCNRAEDQAMAHIEVRQAALCTQVVRILRTTQELEPEPIPPPPSIDFAKV